VGLFECGRDDILTQAGLRVHRRLLQIYDHLRSKHTRARAHARQHPVCERPNNSTCKYVLGFAYDDDDNDDTEEDED